MPFPIRCFTCGKVVARHEQKYYSLLESGLTKKNALDTIGMNRYCCRRMFLTHVNLDDQLLLFPDINSILSGKKIVDKF